MRSLCVFCGSSAGNDPAYRQVADQVGRTIAARGWRLVYGGGSIGLMGVVADGCLAAGGTVVGVIPEFLARKEVLHGGLSELEIVPSMHVRKARMAELSDAFVALPGGLGTFEELFEILTWSQLRLHTKPVGLLNIAGYFDPLLAMIDTAISTEFCRPEHRQLFCADANFPALLSQLSAWKPPTVAKWLGVEATTDQDLAGERLDRT